MSKFIQLRPHRVVTHCRHKSGGIKTVKSALARRQLCTEAFLHAVWHPCWTGFEINGRLEAKRPLASAEPPSVGELHH